MRSLLVAPKGRDNITQKSRVLYRYKCDRLKCDQEYIEESARTFEDSLKELLRALPAIYDHANTSGDHIKLDNFSIVGR